MDAAARQVASWPPLDQATLDDPDRIINGREPGRYTPGGNVIDRARELDYA